VLNKSTITKSFNKAASSYDSVAVLQREVAQRLDERLELITLQPKTIVDLGAGTGISSKLLRQRYPKASIIAVDIADAMLQQQRNTQPHKKTWQICADAEHLPLRPQSVDLIFSNLMLHWCPTQAAVFDEIKRALTPHGLLLFSTLGPDTLKECRASWATVDNFQHVNDFIDLHDVGDALLKADFRDPVMDMDMITLQYSAVNDLLRDLKQLGAHNINAARNKSLTGKQAWQQFHSAYQHYRLDNDKYPASYEVIYGHAWGTEEKSTSAMDQYGEVHISVDHILR